MIDPSRWLVLFWSVAVLLSSDHAVAEDVSTLGQVNFQVSATAPAQENFNRAVAMLHSFWYERLDDAFSKVSGDDPLCGIAYWGLAMSRRELSAWVALVEGERDEAKRQMTKAAELEDSTEKNPVTPGPIIPGREQLADLLLAAMESSAALREFETTLRSAPNRFNGLYGAGKAARLSGDKDKARTHFAKLLEVSSGANSERAELQDAKAFLKSN